MLERTRVRTLPLLNRAADVTPALQACCGTCRTCVTANALTLVGAGLLGATAFLRRFATRVLHHG